MGKRYILGNASFGSLESKLDYILRGTLIGIDMLEFTLKEDNIKQVKECSKMITKDIKLARRVLKKIIEQKV